MEVGSSLYLKSLTQVRVVLKRKILSTISQMLVILIDLLQMAPVQPEFLMGALLGVIFVLLVILGILLLLFLVLRRWKHPEETPTDTKIVFENPISSLQLEDKDEEEDEAAKSQPEESSLSSMPKWTYDVYVSFRGSDSRQGFVSHLYAALVQKGIITFVDNTLAKASLSPIDFKSIEESRFAIVILSKNYASSVWCLDELAHILECRKTFGQIVFPVFLDVEPSEVRKQVGKFGKAFSSYENRFNMDRVIKWRSCLSEIANLSGWIMVDRSGPEVVREIVKYVSNKLNNSFSSIDMEFVGMDSRLEKLQSDLDMESNDVRIIGIWGMGGIGKTAITQAVFRLINNQFEGCCFVADVRELSEKKGLVSLQKFLCKYLLDSTPNILSVPDGINILRSRLSHRKVLIILDDVGNVQQMKALAGVDDKQFTWVGPGSRIIVSTRDKHLLETCGVNIIHEVETLADEEASKLLCLTAFKEGNPPDDYVELSKKVLNYAGGLPLALEVIGSSLYLRKPDAWLETLALIETEPMEEIIGSLRRSYDSLDYDDKEIFLDMACFFNGEDQHHVKKVLNSCGFFSSIGMSILIEKALITIQGNKLQVHNLLQLMAWHIVRQESSKEPGKRSRLGHCSDVLNLLTETKGTDAVQGICLSLPRKKEINLKSDPFIKMQRLRILRIRNIIFSGSLEFCLSNELRVLEWHEYPSASMPPNFHPLQLVELNLFSSRIQLLWNEMFHMEKLISMDLRNCQNLIKTPDFSLVPNLERLILEDCTKLSDIHKSIGELKHLVLLNLKGCESLKRLPQSLRLKCLRTLILTRCSSLEEFPELVEEMEHLSELHLDGTAIRQLPQSVGCLTGLKLLNLRNCERLYRLPSSICSLTMLRSLNLSGCKELNELPENFGSLEHLQELDVSGTAVRQIPSKNPGISYDVFLSFRAENTRWSFVDHLFYALRQRGISVFRDDDNLVWGSSISGVLLRAIEESRIGIVILSSNYASSALCLDKLVHIVKCKEEMGQTILPIFYHVEASNVRNQMGNIGEVLARHVERFGGNKVKKWRESLSKIGNLSGWLVKDRHRSESEVIQEIVGTISNILQNSCVNINNYIIGMDSRITKLESLLRTDLNDVRTIGIWGLGGIGKTTLALEVFKKMSNQFGACCFIANVREEFNKNGLVPLQKQLHKTLLDSNVIIQDVDMGMAFLRSRLRYRRAFIILDDVDQLQQVSALVGNGDQRHVWLASGSRVILTSRDADLLKACGVNDMYAAEALSYDEAFQLFRQKTLSRSFLISDFENLFKKFVAHTKGIPLAIEVLGSHLCLSKEDEWLGTLAKVMKSPETSILGLFQIIYDDLMDTEKDIFLDIACFFKGEDPYRVEKILESCGFNPKVGLDVLIGKSLVKVERGKLWMHDILQDMGRDIACKQFPKVPGKRSRLWDQRDAYNVLVNNMGTETVEAIFLDSSEIKETEIKADPFPNMPRLRFLKISNVNISGNFEYLSNELRILEWEKFPFKFMPSGFEPRTLVELNIPDSHIEQLWNGKFCMETLTQMDLSNCQYLRSTPDFNTVPNIEKLILESCKRLSRVHKSIEKLKHLTLLNLKNCESLLCLPSIIKLESLQTLYLSGCLKFCEFPELVGDMGQLFELYLDGTSIRELPESIGCLTGLNGLNLSNCMKLLCLPSVICHLKSLESLNISGCSRIQLLPESLGSLENLREFDASGTNIRELPSSIMYLKNLERLSMRGCKYVDHKSWDLIFCSPSLGLLSSGLISLTSLNLCQCNLTEGVLPEYIGSLSSLQYLELSENKFISIPESISQLFKLEELHLSKCSSLRSLPKHLPLSLKYVDVTDCPMLHSNDLIIWSSISRFINKEKLTKKEDQTMQPLSVPEEFIDPLLSKIIEDQISHEKQFEIHFPYSRIPDWCSHLCIGSSLTIKLPRNSDSNKTWMGLALYAVFEMHGREGGGSWESEDAFCQLNTNDGHINNAVIFQSLRDFKVESYGICCYKPLKWFGRQLNEKTEIGISISTSPGMEVKRCGIHFIYEEATKFAHDLSETAHEYLKLKLCPHCMQFTEVRPQNCKA